MTVKRTQARIRVQVAVWVDLGATWGEDCTVAQVRGQGEEDALNRLGRLLGADPHVRVAGVTAHEIVIGPVDA